MSYRLRFHELALAEWRKLDRSIREPLSGMPDCYKIKLAAVGYRLVYRVEDETVFVTVIAAGKRDRLKVYEAAKSRL